MEVLAVLTLVTFMMDFASAKYIIQGNLLYVKWHELLYHFFLPFFLLKKTEDEIHMY